MTLSVLGSANWLTHWYRRGGRLSIEEIGDTIISMALDGLRAPAKPAATPRIARVEAAAPAAVAMP
jgi:hypothetical protein